MSFRIALPAVFLALSAVLCPLTAAAAARALLISDVHLDPFVDVTQARAIEHLPVEAWPALFAGEVVERPDFRQCAEPGPTTSPALWARTLQAITAAADDSAFTVVSGDLLVHQMQCRHAQLFPDADAGQYREFAARMVTYILRSVRAATHGRPVYLALGNHDSGCGNYRRDVHDPFLARLAGEVAAAASSDPQEQAGIGDSFARHGAYRIAQAPVAFPLALAVVDTTPLSRNALACDGTPADGAAEAMHWLEQGIQATAAANRPLWLIGHIPPGVDVRTSLSTEPWAQRYASVVVDGDAQTRVVPFLADERLATIIAADAATVKLALFGHTHMNEWRMLGDVPTKLLPSVSPSNGNFPAFTIGTIDGDGTLLDYQVHAATDLQASAWTVQPSFRSLYGVSGFSAGNIALLLRDARPRYRAQYMIGQPQAPFLDDDSTFGKYLCSLALIAPQDYARCAAAAVDSH